MAARVATVALVGIGYMLWKWQSSRKRVILYTYLRSQIIPSISPNSLKLETYLRMGNIPHQLEFTPQEFTPQDNLPRVSYEESSFTDCNQSILFLNQTFTLNLNNNCDPRNLKAAKVCRDLLENHFYWGIVAFRTNDDFDYTDLLNSTKHSNSLARKVRNSSDIHVITTAYLQNVSQALGNMLYFGGDEPCEDDCGIFGTLAQCMWAMPGSRYERLIHEELINLGEYCDRMRNRYWPDWENCLDC